MLEVVLRSPRKVLPLEAETGARRRGVEHGDRRRRHFLSDAVAGDDRDAICLHAHHSPNTFHQRNPTGNQIARCASETMNPIRHQAGCDT